MNSNKVKQSEQGVPNPSEKNPNLVILFACWRQSSTWTSADLQSIGPLGINFSEIVIEIQTLSLKIHLKVSSAIFMS